MAAETSVQFTPIQVIPIPAETLLGWGMTSSMEPSMEEHDVTSHVDHLVTDSRESTGDIGDLESAAPTPEEGPTFAQTILLGIGNSMDMNADTVEDYERLLSRVTIDPHGLEKLNQIALDNIRSRNASDKLTVMLPPLAMASRWTWADIKISDFNCNITNASASMHDANQIIYKAMSIIDYEDSIESFVDIVYRPLGAHQNQSSCDNTWPEPFMSTGDENDKYGCRECTFVLVQRALEIITDFRFGIKTSSKSKEMRTL